MSSKAPKKGVYLEHLTWNQAEPILKKAKAILLPLGSNMKQHGHHLPLNSDWILAEYLTQRILDEIDLPAVATMGYGFYPAFINYPGSIHLSKGNSQGLISDVCRSITKYGPKKIYVLNTGFSTNFVLEPTRQALAKEGIILEYLDLFELTNEIEKNVKEQPYGSHADEIETSMMLYINPSVVNLELAKPELALNKKGPFSRVPDSDIGIYSPTGSWGDPTLATYKKGEIVTERLVVKLVTLINEFLNESFIPRAAKDCYL